MAVSIHVPRTGDDFKVAVKVKFLFRFQSTSPARRTTRERKRSGY